MQAQRHRERKKMAELNKTRDILLAISLVIALVGCEAQTSRSFSHTMEDGSYVTIDIEYKPKSQIEGDKKFGSYYYIVRLQPSSSFDPKIHYPLVHIAFYDEKGHSLFNILSDNTLSPGWNINADEVNRIDGGYEWKGQFYEKHITLENFRDIHSIKVYYHQRR
jgi:hypothetical protein